jgi:DNA-binding MarR family transcriptional regulator
MPKSKAQASDAVEVAFSKAIAPHLHEVHHLLWECYTLTIPLGDAVFEGTDLSIALSGTLDLIGALPGSTVADIARTGPKTQQAVSQLVSRLEKAGYVERRVGGGRGVELYLTQSGVAAREEGHRREDLLEEQLRSTLGDETYAQLVEQLSVARDRLRRHNHDTDGDL